LVEVKRTALGGADNVGRPHIKDQRERDIDRYCYQELDQRKKARIAGRAQPPGLDVKCAGFLDATG
jgi:hypothetical protein